MTMKSVQFVRSIFGLRERSATCEVLTKRKARDLCPVLFESNCGQLMAAA
jgi:hypothetical protein